MTTQDLYKLPLSEFMKHIASRFWFRIEFARQSESKMRVSETTLTEDLIFNFHLMSQGKNLPVRLFQSVNEKTNGSDIEILMQIGESVYKFPCQAKIIYPTRRYGALRHQVAGVFQIDLLLRYAQQVGGYPLYIFYNYDQYLIPQLLEITDGSPYPWGCSFGSAQAIRSQFFDTRTPAPLFRDLHPGICWPFHMLFEKLPKKSKERMFNQMLPEFSLSHLHAYELDTIENDRFFTELTKPGELGKIDHYDHVPFKIDNRTLVEQSQSFSPRYRILITTKRTGGLKIAYLR